MWTVSIPLIHTSTLVYVSSLSKSAVVTRVRDIRDAGNKMLVGISVFDDNEMSVNRLQ